MNVYRDLNNLPQFNNSVVTIGTFDGVHTGHQAILKRINGLAREIGGDSVVITFYPHPRAIIDAADESVTLLNTLEEKISLLQNYGIDKIVVVPFSFEFSQIDPKEYIENFLVKSFSPKFIVIGYDHKFGLNRKGDIDLLRTYENQYNFKVIEIPKQELDEVGISSTKIRNALNDGDLALANLFLGQPYMLSGKVIHGDKLGSKLGYPTANLQILEKSKLIPREGVYAVKVHVDHVEFEGMMYIGKRPSVTEQEHINIEINIFDFSENIYDKTIRISILEFLRKDIKFDNLEDLKSQLLEDELQAQNVLHKAKTNEVKQQVILTIAILNYNGEELLESYLPMLEYSSSRYNFEICVIDNNSSDDSVKFVKEWYPEITVNELSKNYGFAGGYNKGIQDITSKYIALINSDVLVTQDWLDPIIEFMESNKNIGVVQPKIKCLENKENFEYAGASGGFLDALGYPFCRGRIFENVEKDEEQYEDPIEIFWASGAAMVCKTDLFKKIGGFDEKFFAHQEEIDLCWRIKRAGYMVFVLPKSVVYHLGGGTLAYSNPNKDYLNFRNNLYLLTKNEPINKLTWLIPLRLILDGIAALKFLFEGHYKSTFSVLRAHITYYISLPNIIEQGNIDAQNIKNIKIAKETKLGRYKKSIVIKRFLYGKKIFSQLKSSDFEVK